MTTTRGTIVRMAMPFAIVAFAVAGAAMLLPLFFGPSDAMLTALMLGGYVAIPLVAVIGGVLAARPAGTVVDGMGAGAIVGAGVLLGTAIGLTILGVFVGGDPTIQEFVRNSEPDPTARIPYDWIAPVGALTGALIGLIAGAGDFVLATVAGLVTGAITGHAPQAVAPQPAR